MAENYAQYESVRQHMEESGRYLAAVHVDRCARMLSCSSYESPLEAMFYVWWMAMVRAGEISESVVAWDKQVEVVANGNRYRLDFVIEPEYQMKRRANECGVPVPKLAVELDGHDYHERTKEQVIRRNQRDRDLAADGWDVMHFSGSELYRNPTNCLQEVFDRGFKAFGWELEQQVLEAEWRAAQRAAENEAGAQLVGKADAKV